MKSEILIHPEELSRRWIDRMAEQGVTILGLHPVGGRKAADTLGALLERLETPAFRELLDYAAARGLEIEYEMHAASYLLPRELFDSHPAYFRMDANGERVRDTNFCVTNPEALELYAANAAELVSKLYRSRHSYELWLDDSRGKSCQCPSCRRYSVAEQQLLVQNRVLRELKKTIPDARLAHIAYLDCLDVPQRVAPEAGIFLEFAPMERHIKREDGIDYAAQEREMMHPLLCFFGCKGAKVLEYWLDNSLLSGWKKPPRLLAASRESVHADLDAYQAAGFETAATFGCYLGADYEALYGAPDITPYTDWF